MSFGLMKYNIVNDVIIFSSFLSFVSRILFPESFSIVVYIYKKASWIFENSD